MKIYKYLIVLCFIINSSCSSGGGSDDSLTPTEDITAPSVPINLAESNITTTSIDLSWTASTDNVGVKNYSIYKDGEALVTISSTTHSASGLIANTAYAFKVKARDAAGNESGFSNVVNVKTEDNTATLVTTSGNIETYLGVFIDGTPGDSGNNYVVPTTNQLNTWSLVIDALLFENINEAVLKSSEFNYQINEFTDTSLTPNQIFYILEEKSNKSNYWGTYVFSKTPTISNLIIQAPHIKNDTNTGKQAVYCFKNNVAKAVFISGAHRCNNNNSSSCSGTTTICNSGSEAYRVSDLAHNTQSVFQQTTENVFNAVSNSVFIQLHGFGKQASDPYVIMSNGTQVTPSPDYATQIKDALFTEDNMLTFKIAHIDTDWTRLRGFTNTQGRFINNSSNPCSTSATQTTGRFIHIEQERARLRESATEWVKMSNALKSVFD
tara:strand:- start:3396 stop:4706 length:1311 start_codon:yes stop_codon:yes gene_type:complete